MTVRFCPHQRHRVRMLPQATVRRPFRELLAPLIHYAADGLVVCAIPLLLVLALVGWFCQPPPVRDDWPD